MHLRWFLPARRSKRVVVALLCPLVVGALVGCGGVNGSGGKVPARVGVDEPTSPLTSARTTSPIPKPVAESGIVLAGRLVSPGAFYDLDFVNTSTGFGLVAGVDHVVRSDDAGSTWRTVGNASSVAAASSDIGDAHVLFTSDRTGYVYGQGLAITDDSGETWRYPSLPVAAGSFISSIAAIGSSVWATAACRPTVACRGTVVASNDGGAKWYLPASQPAVEGSLVGVTRLSESVAFVSTQSESRQRGRDLAVTRDAGRSWQTMFDPCTVADSVSVHIAATVGRLWLVCVGSGGAGGEPVAVYQSGDQGAHWAPRSSFGVRGLCDLAATSSTQAWLACSDTEVKVTGDGGATWRDAIPGTTPEDGATKVTFIDDHHGWALGRERVWRTVDGQNWSAA